MTDGTMPEPLASAPQVRVAIKTDIVVIGAPLGVVEATVFTILHLEP
jgi:hypothetical protein